MSIRLRLVKSVIFTFRNQGIKGVMRKFIIFMRNKIDFSKQNYNFYTSLIMKKISILQKDAFSVLIISGCKGDTVRYRALHKKEQLELYGIRCHILTPPFIYSLTSNYNIIILQRLMWSDSLERLIFQVRRLNRIAIFDVDDLIFEPEVIPWLKLTLSELPEKANFYSCTTERFLKTMLECDYVMTSTDYLAEVVRKKGKMVFVVRNALSKELIDISERILKTDRKSEEKKITLGYLSGSNTHNRDFAEINEALLFILRKYNSVILYIVGYLSLDDAFKSFGDRIKRMPFVYWKKLPSIIKTLDINLVPLEQDNPFSQAKSEIKYLEAGICGVPTVASRIGAYEHAIKNGFNGFLATTTSEWINYLELLVNNEKLRIQIGQNAREDVIRRYSPSTCGKELREILKEILQDKKI